MHWTLLLGLAAAAEPPAPHPHRFFVSSSLFMSFNLLLPESPSFYQLNFGWRMTPRDVLLVEAITWTYDAPLGVQYWQQGPAFPGHLRDWGVGLAWQHFWWRDLFTTVHATPMAHLAYDQDGEHLSTGFFLFVVGRVGWHLEWRDRLWFEPSVAVTSWPVETGLPPAFQAIQDDWPRYFLFEPGLNVGVNF